MNDTEAIRVLVASSIKKNGCLGAYAIRP